MSEEQEVETEAEEPVAEAPKPEPEKPEEEEAPPAEGKQFIDFKDLPPQVEARFRRIYGNMKEYERVAQETAKVNRALVDRLEKLESGELQDRITSLQQRQKEAFEAGDYDKAQQLTNELLDHKLAEKNRAKIEVPEFKAADQPLSDAHMDMLAAWARETDESGSALRPWANPQHKDHARAVRYIQAAAMDPDFDVETSEGFQELLSAVDQRMGGKGKSQPAKPRTAAVLSGNGDGRPRSTDKTVKLSAEERRVAEMMGYEPAAYAALMKKHGVRS